MGVPAVVVGGHVAGDHHHGDAIEGGVGDAGGRVGETRTEVAENDRGPSSDTRVPVGGMRGDLFVPHVDELDLAVGHGGEDRDVGVSAETEDVADAAPFQIVDELFSSGWVTSAHCGTPDACAPAGGDDVAASGGTARWSGPRYEWLIGSTRRIGVIVWRSSLAWARIPASREAMNKALPRSLGNPTSLRIAAITPSMLIGIGLPIARVSAASSAAAAARWSPATSASRATDRSRVEPGVAALVLAVAEAGYPLAVRPPVGDQIVGSDGQRTAARGS